MKYDVVGLGVCTMDLLMVVDELPAGELVQKAHATALAGGGPVATAMVTLSRLGAKSAMLDRIGGDLTGKMIVAELEAEGVDTCGMVREARGSSARAAILVRKRDGARAISFAPGSCGDLRPERLDLGRVREAKILHVNGRHWQACLHAAQAARGAGVLVSFDGGSHRFDPEHRALLPLVDVCIVAEEYAARCTGVASPQLAAGALLNYGARVVAVTCGAKGSYLALAGGASWHQPAFLVPDVADTTGAGDAYHGAFLFGISRGCSYRECARLASAAGALNTQALGGRAALPTLDELEVFLKTQS